MENVKQLKPAQVEEVERDRLPDLQLFIKGNGRAIAVAKLREYADLLESGELDGCRIQWRARHPEEVQEGKPSEMQTVTVTHIAPGRPVGTVQLLTTTIEEE